MKEVRKQAHLSINQPPVRIYSVVTELVFPIQSCDTICQESQAQDKYLNALNCFHHAL